MVQEKTASCVSSISSHLIKFKFVRLLQCQDHAWNAFWDLILVLKEVMDTFQDCKSFVGSDFWCDFKLSLKTNSTEFCIFVPVSITLMKLRFCGLSSIWRKTLKVLFSLEIPIQSSSNLVRFLHSGYVWQCT